MLISKIIQWLGLTLAGLVLVACDGRVYTRDGVTDGDTFYLAEAAHTNPDPVLQAWVAYSLDLTTCQLHIGGENPARNSSFECEYGARLSLAENWGERRISNPLVEDPYLDGLLEIQAAGFLKEYVTRHYKRRGWELPDDLNQDAFRRWYSAQMKGHIPQTRLIGSWNFRDTQ